MTHTSPIDQKAAAIVAAQIKEHGPVPLDLPRFRPFSPLALNSRVLRGSTEFLALVIGARRYEGEFIETTEALYEQHRPRETSQVTA